jgi:hypothetical protein
MLTKKSFKSLLKSLKQSASDSSGTTYYDSPNAAPMPSVPYFTTSSNTSNWQPPSQVPAQVKQWQQQWQAQQQVPYIITTTPGAGNYTVGTGSGTFSLSGGSGDDEFSDQYWPWTQWDVKAEDERALITDFKSRHPDFDTLHEEIQLILMRKTGLKNTPLFISLLYELAKDIKKLLDNYTDPDKIEGILNGKTEETTG